MDKLKVFVTLSKLFKEHHFSLYLVGGTVRDFLLNKNIDDMDAVTDATPIEMKEFLEGDYTFEKMGSIKCKFEGVKFEATLIIQSANSNEDASINYNGFFNVAFNNGEKSQVFSTHSGNGIIASGQQQKSATIFFPAKNITNKTYCQSAYISLGSPNPNIINRKIQMDFNLMRTPILKAR